MSVSTLANFINNEWVVPGTDALDDVTNPATGEVLAHVPLGGTKEVDTAVAAASDALPSWSGTPVTDRIQFLFKLKALLEDEFENIARIITEECGKTLAESRGELRRGVENVEVACGAPILMQGHSNEDIARGIDEIMFRQPVGVCAIITPFNFPAMIPFWFLPYAIACGNTVVCKPSEKVPRTMAKIIELLERTGLPAGVVNMVHGGKEAVDRLLEHPEVKAVSFVGSTHVAKAVYAKAAAHGKRVQAQGGAKNPIIILPDADPKMTVKIVTDSAFGCAGQRCLAASLAVTVGSAGKTFPEMLREAALERVVGNGLEDGVHMGPVINHQSRERIEALVEDGVSQGARLVLDGRGSKIQGCEAGSFVNPTILDGLAPEAELIGTEIFGPVLTLLNFDNVDQVIEFVNQGKHGNMACLFTTSGANARKFRHEAIVGNIGINIGVAAPMAFFPFSGWKDSFFGDLHAQGRHGFEFFTQTKVVVERWPEEWSRQF
jgi:malonate-semialdehyde dehydrogenase (acetylating) / methylmalonate-semialdehyde dehydrogenase